MTGWLVAVGAPPLTVAAAGATPQILVLLLGTLAAVALAQTSRGRRMGTLAAAAGLVAVVVWLLVAARGGLTR